MGCGRWRGTAGAHDRLGRGPSVASPVRRRRMSPSSPQDWETTGGGEDGGGGENLRSDGEGTGTAGRACLRPGRQMATRRVPWSRERQQRGLCWSRGKASWDGQSRDGDRMVRDYKGAISVKTVETLSCDKVPWSSTKPFYDSNLRDSLKQEVYLRIYWQ